MKKIKYCWLFFLLFAADHGTALGTDAVERLKLCPENEKEFFHNCEGFREYIGEGLYFGEFQNNQRHGKGVIGNKPTSVDERMFPTANQLRYPPYIGYWASDKRNGWGVDSVEASLLPTSDNPTVLYEGQGSNSGMWVNNQFVSGDVKAPEIQQQKDELINWEHDVYLQYHAQQERVRWLGSLSYNIAFLILLSIYVYTEFFLVPKKSIVKFGDFRLDQQTLVFINKDNNQSFPLHSIGDVKIINQRNWYFVGAIFLCLINWGTNSEASNDEHVFPELLAKFLSNKELASETFLITPTIALGLIFFLLSLRTRYAEITLDIGGNKSITTSTQGFGFVNPKKFLRTLAYRKSLKD